MQQSGSAGPIQSLADFLEVSADGFDELGIFNGYVNRDYPLFISPYLLRNYRRGDFGSAFETLYKHFHRVLESLNRSENRGDRAWAEARNALRFEEVPEIGLGYSFAGVGGRSITETEKDRFLSGLQKLLYLKIDAPEHIAMATLFEDGIGPDRMSDLIASCIRKHIIQYTDRMCSKLRVADAKLRTFSFKTRGDSYRLPVHPASGDSPRPLLLLPIGILSEPPSASSPRQLPRLFEPHSRDRLLLVRLIMRASRGVRGRQQVLADEVYQNVSSLPEKLRSQMADRFEKAFSVGCDREAIAYAYELGKSLVAARSGQTGIVHTREDLRQFIERLCEEVSENTRRNRRIFFPRDKALSEEEIQSALEMLFSARAKDADVHFERASPTAEKPDFMFTKGGLKGCIELKPVKPETRTGKIKDWPAQVKRYVDSHDYQPAILLLIDMCEVDSPVAKRKWAAIDSAMPAGKYGFMKKYTVDSRPRCPASKEKAI